MSAGANDSGGEAPDCGDAVFAAPTAGGSTIETLGLAASGPDPRLIQAIVAHLPAHRSEPRVIRTSGAWVILSGDQAWKCLRSRRTRWADLTQASARRVACGAELELNRRFAPEVYLGLAALVIGPGGRFELIDCAEGNQALWTGSGGALLPEGGSACDGAPAEWLIRMKRLRASSFLDQALAAGGVGLADMDRIAARLRAMHAGAPVSRIEPARFAGRFAAEIDTGARVLGNWAGPAATALSALAQSLEYRLEERVRQRCVIDGHGDLRPAHLNLGEAVRVIDALDCDRMLRQVDPWEELSLLALMSAELGAAWFGPVLARRYRTIRVDYGRSSTGAPVADPPEPELLAFYCAYHAFTRARLAWAHLGHSPGDRVRHWARLARRFMRSTEAALDGWTALGAER